MLNEPLVLQPKFAHRLLIEDSAAAVPDVMQEQIDAAARPASK